MTQGKKKPFLLIFLIGYLAYSAIYVARLNFSVASALLEAGGILDKAQIGIIGSIFSFTYAVSKIPNGYIGDRFSSRKVIVIGLMIVSVSNLLIGWFPGFWSIAALWGGNAYGQSMLWGPMLRTFSECCEEKKAKKVSQFLVSSVAAGSIIGLWLATYCASYGSAAFCFLLPGCVTAVMALVVKFFFADAAGAAKSRKGSIGQSFRNVWGEPEFRRIIFPAIAHGMIKDNINVWLGVYFIDTFQIDLERVAGYVFIIPVFALLGRMLYPAVYRILKNDSMVSGFSFLCCAVAAAVLCTDGVSALVAMVCLGVLSAMVAMINTHMLSIFPTMFSAKGSLSFTASVMDLLTYTGAGIGSLIFGMLIQYFGFKSMFLIWGAVSVASFLLLELFRRCRQQR